MRFYCRLLSSQRRESDGLSGADCSSYSAVTRSTHSDVSDPGRLQYGAKRVRGVDASPLSIEEGVYTRSKKVKVVEAIHTSSSAVEPGTLLSRDEGSTGPTSTNLRVLDAHELSNGLDSEESSMHRDKGGAGDIYSGSPPAATVLTEQQDCVDPLLGLESSLNIIAALYSNDMDETETVAVAADEVGEEVGGDPALVITVTDSQSKLKQFDGPHIDTALDQLDGNHGKSAGKDLKVGQNVAVVVEERSGLGAQVEAACKGRHICDRTPRKQTTDGED